MHDTHAHRLLGLEEPSAEPPLLVLLSDRCCSAVAPKRVAAVAATPPPPLPVLCPELAVVEAAIVGLRPPNAALGSWSRMLRPPGPMTGVCAPPRPASHTALDSAADMEEVRPESGAMLDGGVAVPGVWLCSAFRGVDDGVGTLFGDTCGRIRFVQISFVCALAAVPRR